MFLTSGDMPERPSFSSRIDFEDYDTAHTPRINNNDYDMGLFKLFQIMIFPISNLNLGSWYQPRDNRKPLKKEKKGDHMITGIHIKQP